MNITLLNRTSPNFLMQMVLLHTRQGEQGVVKTYQRQPMSCNSRNGTMIVTNAGYTETEVGVAMIKAEGDERHGNDKM